jgi:hypothetical protein
MVYFIYLYIAVRINSLRMILTSPPGPLSSGEGEFSERGFALQGEPLRINPSTNTPQGEFKRRRSLLYSTPLPSGKGIQGMGKFGLIINRCCINYIQR